MRSALLLAASLFALGAAATEPPTSAAVRKAFEKNRGAIVRVLGPRGSGPGVIVGRDGHVLTSVAFVGLERAKVRWGGETYEAQVVMADAYRKVAVVRFAPPAEVRAAPVELETGLARGDFLVAVRAQRNGDPVPEIVQVAHGPRGQRGFVGLTVPHLAGTALFDPRGKLVAVATGGTAALPVRAVKLQLEADAAGAPRAEAEPP